MLGQPYYQSFVIFNFAPNMAMNTLDYKSLSYIKLELISSI